MQRGSIVLTCGLLALLLAKVVEWLFHLQDSSLTLTIAAMLAAQFGFSCAERIKKESTKGDSESQVAD